MPKLKIVASAGALYLVSMVVFVLFVGLLSIPPGPFPAQGPMGFAPALLTVHAFVVGVLVLLALRSRVSGRALALLLFVALYGIQTVMLQIETVAFNRHIGLSLPDIGRLLLIHGLYAGVVSLLAARIFAGGGEGAAPPPSGLGWRIAAATAAYVACYFAAGHFIAWSSEAVRTYYDNGAQIDRLWVLALQIVRGILWSLLALFIVLRLRGSAWERVAVMAATFAVLSSVLLLYPNSYMPADVASVHLVEMTVSEAIWGAIAALLLGPMAAYRKE